MKPGSILLVEDDPNDRMLVGRAFRKTGYGDVLRAVATVAEAREHVTAGPSVPVTRAVMLDLKLRGESGFDLLRWLRRPDSPHRFLPVVLFTSSHEASDVQAAYELGATGFFVKPADCEELIEIVRVVVGHWVALNRAPGEP
jgi:CheY-like chemotaxis protein